MSGKYPLGRITHNVHGEMDSVMATEVDFIHIERADAGHWWVDIRLADGGTIRVDLSTERPARTLVTGTARRG